MCFQVAPMETISVIYRLVPLVPGHVLLPKVAVVPDREKVRHKSSTTLDAAVNVPGKVRSSERAGVR